MKRLALLHTVALLADRFRIMLREKLPGVDTFHMVDESLLQDLMRRGPSAVITGRIVTLAGLAADAGADLIVFTCSSTSPSIDVARQCINVPILKIDDPMAKKAVQLGQKISVVCTTNSTLEPSANLVMAHAQRLGIEVKVNPVLVDGAYQALQNGHHDIHDELVERCVAEVEKESDVIVLAQASMAHLAAPLGAHLSRPVLSSPPLLMEALADLQASNVA